MWKLDDLVIIIDVCGNDFDEEKSVDVGSRNVGRGAWLSVIPNFLEMVDVSVAFGLIELTIPFCCVSSDQSDDSFMLCLV